MRSRLRSLVLSLLVGAATLLAPPATATPAEGVPVRVAASLDRVAGPDSDGDGLEDAADGCPGVASSNPTGCPTVARGARLRYLEGRNLLQARITSTVTGCVARARIKLWRVAPGGDVRLQVESASFAGVRRFRVPGASAYYVTVSSSYAPGIAECAEATSRTVRVP